MVKNKNLIKNSRTQALNLTRFCFSVSYIRSLYAVDKKQRPKSEKKKLKTLPTYPIFLDHVTPSAVTRRIFILFNKY